ncbi:MAG TPA: tetratricopeptide repeat protein, partial [Chitinophagaceae bacterium]|nr:tetratricopeptide repeat protein [Chitinophagaceae bacterium]
MKKNLFTFAATCLIFLSSFSQTTAKEWLDKGISLKKEGNCKDAIEAFKKALSLQPDYADAFHQSGWCYNELGQYDDAVNALLKEEKNNPSDPASNNFELGYAYKNLRKYEDAIPRFNKAIELDKGYSLAYKERGNSYYKQMDYEKALEDYNQYATLASGIEDATFYYNKGWCENELKKYNDAVSSLKKCVELDDQYSDAYSELGYACFELNLNDAALTNYRISMNLDKETDYHPILGIADVFYDNLKNYDSALVYYEKGVKLTQKNKTAYYRLGWCYNDKDRFEDAMYPLQQAVSLDPEYTVAQTELGYSYYKLKRYDDALSQFRPVMAKDDKNELSRYYSGFCYYLKNDMDNLRKMYNELKALNTTQSLGYAETLSKYLK